MCPDNIYEQEQDTFLPSPTTSPFLSLIQDSEFSSLYFHLFQE